MIIGNCDNTLFLGDKGKKTLKELSEILGNVKLNGNILITIS